MKIYVLAVLLLTLLLVSDSEEGWIRRATRRVRLRRVAKFIRRNERLIQLGIYAARRGKRAAEPPCKEKDQMDRQEALEKLESLALQCPNFGINGQKLRWETVEEAFNKVDKDKDRAFDDDELKRFENILDAYQVCTDTSAAQASGAQGENGE